MRVLITGATGLIGSALAKQLKGGGHNVFRLVRNGARPREDEIAWDPAERRINPDQLEGADAVVHLAGENIAAGRWTAARKARIRDSRVAATRFLAETLQGLHRPPSVFACGSAVHYYGSRGDEVLREESPPGTGFLPRVCQEWESSARLAEGPKTRVCALRFGMVLSASGGALAKMLPFFKLGLGGVLGNGRQYWAWITLADAVRAIEHVISSPTLSGPVNVVSPQQVTNREFTRRLGQVIHRPTFLPVPALGARVLLGQMADDLLLSSTRVEPARLMESGFSFLHPDLAEALAGMMERATDA